MLMTRYEIIAIRLLVVYYKTAKIESRSSLRKTELCSGFYIHAAPTVIPGALALS